MKTKITFFLLFLTVFFTNAQSLQWAKAMIGIGGAGGAGRSIVVDASGNAFTTGNFSGLTDFDPGTGTFTLDATNGNAYISKLDASGNFVWAKQIGGGSGTSPVSIALDASGNIYTTGNFSGTGDFDPGAGTYTFTSAGSADTYISKLDPSGNFVWAVSTGNTTFDKCNALAIDASSNVYTIGTFSTTVDFDPGPGTFTLASAGFTDIYISKLDAAGSFQWAKRMGTTQSENGTGIGVDGTGNVYLGGSFGSTMDFDPGAGTFTMSTAGSADIFIEKLDASGNFQWAKRIGNVLADEAHALAVDASGNVYTSGWYTSSADFDPGPGVFTLNSAGSYEIFVSKLDASGNFVWAASMGGTGTDDSYDIAVDAGSNVYVSGYFSGTADFDPGVGTYTLVNASSLYDGYVVKLDPSGNFILAAAFGGTNYDYAYGVACDAIGNVYATGSFINTVDFDPSAGVFNLVSGTVGVNNAYVVKLGSGATGINAIELVSGIRIYPNPTSGEFSLSFNEEVKGYKQMTVFDINGKEILKQTIQEGVKQIELEIRTSGMYFINLEIEGKRLTKKVVVQ